MESRAVAAGNPPTIERCDVAEGCSRLGDELRPPLRDKRVLAKSKQIGRMFTEDADTPTNESRTIDHIRHARDVERFAIADKVNRMRIRE